MIKRLYIDNYKSLVNFELPLRELTLLLGPNGVGKTSVLDVVFAMRLLLSGQVIRFRRRCCAPITPS